MSCHQSHLLTPLLDGELPAGEAERVRQHVASCAACTAEWDELRAVSTLMSAARRSTMGQPSEDAMARLRLHVQGLVETADVGLIWMARIFSGVAASVLIAGLWLVNQPVERPSAQTSGAWERAAYTLSVDPAPVTTVPDLRSPEAILDDLAGTNLSSAGTLEAELP